jgi:hypothetical protein
MSGEWHSHIGPPAHAQCVWAVGQTWQCQTPDTHLTRVQIASWGWGVGFRNGWWL